MDSHLAQINVARAAEPLDSPRLAEFVAALEPVNARADNAPGFVWRLQSDGGDATSIRVFDDDLIIVNMSVWSSMPALWQFVYSGGHLDVMRRRREWFEVADAAHMALWWVPADSVPTVEDGIERLETIRRNGPGPRAFTFKHPHDPE